jgi:hypothetical protein
MEFNLHARVDALQRGECGEEHFLQEILSLREAAPNLVWATLALIDQRYRRGHLTGELFRSINSRLARHALEEPEYGATVDLHPANGRVRPVTAQIVPTDGAAATPVASRDENSAHPIVSLSEVSAFAAESAGPAIEPLIESVKAGTSAQTGAIPWSACWAAAEWVRCTGHWTSSVPIFPKATAMWRSKS